MSERKPYEPRGLKALEGARWRDTHTAAPPLLEQSFRRLVEWVAAAEMPRYLWATRDALVTDARRAMASPPPEEPELIRWWREDPESMSDQERDVFDAWNRHFAPASPLPAPEATP